jgi:hypothetical protein
MCPGKGEQNSYFRLFDTACSRQTFICSKLVTTNKVIDNASSIFLLNMELMCASSRCTILQDELMFGMQYVKQ